jgi:hypothetical protein
MVGGLPVLLPDLFLYILPQFPSPSGCGGPGNRIVATFGGWLMGHNDATVSSNKIRGIMCTPPAVSLLVGVPVRKARFAPRTSITHRQEGVVIGIGTLSHLAGVLPVVLGTRLPACRAHGRGEKKREERERREREKEREIRERREEERREEERRE